MAQTTKGSTIVVTGAAGALGEGVVRSLVARGHRVAAVARASSEARLRALEAELGDACVGFSADVASIDDWTALLRDLTSRLGTPTGAALVAGGWTGGFPLHEAQGDASYRTLLAQNLDTVRTSLHALLPGMVAERRGSIVVVGARPSLRPELGAGMADYTATKAAVVALAQAAAAEVLPHHVRINAILPTTIDTPSNRQAMPGADVTTWVSIPSLAGVVAFLLSDEARDISGAAIPVYGRA
ncbi:SDR family NAD(P)-dependent oxidoreductase [Chondromyces crocatus]|uniref:3-oxoacyl-ACP reductase n=1 Tax=Chondromyces crocatus TaxID=52 RepID=A0A0K1ETM5_CHOCO|nr:SDR family NAD(P)-dependent oxidoreductase [Chondromyces crocatus]AKT43983.1 3-oxoacyl-ACP reductase [Chondromyces crocatus]